jgi:hypothetical protein
MLQIYLPMGTGETEKITKFWQVKDMFDFENIGFSHTSDGKKYLTCADCEKPCFGIQIVESGRILLARSRVICE